MEFFKILYVKLYFCIYIADCDREYFLLADSAKISNVIKILKDSESVDICFLADITGSMDEYVKPVKSAMNFHIPLRRKFPGIKLRCAFIGYRDYDEKGRKSEPIVKNFTSNSMEFENFLEKEIKFDGGLDRAEDVFSGLELVPTLTWINKSRILFHIADAPCHGKMFHDESLKIFDFYPNGDPDGRQIHTLLERICEKNIDYYFTEINESTREMIDVFNRELDLIQTEHSDWKINKITNFELKYASDLYEKITTSLTTTITNVQTATIHQDYGNEKDRKPLKNKIISKLNLDFSMDKLKEHKAEIYKFKFIDDASKNESKLNDIRKLMQNYKNKIPNQNGKIFEKVKIERVQTTVKICESPFDKGNLRYAYAALAKLPEDKEYKKYVAKNSLYVDKDRDSYNHNKEEILLQMLVKYLAEKFNEENIGVMPLKFLDVYLLQSLDTKEYFCIEEYLDGTFKKWSGSLGHINPTIYSNTLVTVVAYFI